MCLNNASSAARNSLIDDDGSILLCSSYTGPRAIHRKSRQTKALHHLALIYSYSHYYHHCILIDNPRYRTKRVIYAEYINVIRDSFCVRVTRLKSSLVYRSSSLNLYVVTL